MILIVVLYFALKKDKALDYSNITDYHACQEAGYPISASFPPECTLPDGRSFVEDVRETKEVELETPSYGGMVNSPLTVKGKAKGNWFFEANLPVTLKDQNGKVLAKQGAHAEGDWMTEDFVDFSVTLTFDKPDTQYGVLLIEKDNPSGLPENDGAYAIPVTFK